MRGRKNYVIYILLVLFVSLFIYSTYKVVVWKLENNKSSKIINDIKEDVKIIKDDDGEEGYKIDFDSLKKKNVDTVAFIKVNGTNIEYPVVKSKDNDYYLNHSFDNSYNSAGWVFANYLNKFDDSDRNISIFAHARRDGSMFGTLYKTLSSEWQSNKDNYLITFITEKGIYKYQVFSTYRVLSEDYYIKNSFNDDEYNQFLNTIKSRSNKDYGVEVDKNDSILTLSTCANDENYRIVLHAKKTY